MTTITLVEQHVIKPTDPRFEVIDAAAFAAKNLYNRANYAIRQAFIHKGEFIPYAKLAKDAKLWDSSGSFRLKSPNGCCVC